MCRPSLAFSHWTPRPTETRRASVLTLTECRTLVGGPTIPLTSRKRTTALVIGLFVRRMIESEPAPVSFIG